MVNTREYEWADVSVVMAGRMVTGLRGVKYSAKQEKELLHAKGNKPHSIQRGNKTYDGEITLLQSEYEALKQACGGDILDASIDIVAAYGNPSAGDVITTDILVGVEFTEDNTEWKQGDKYQEKTLPFLFIDKKSA
nr:MAG TPA: putative XkdM-like protein [Caudoviricetes sp.]